MLSSWLILCQGIWWFAYSTATSLSEPNYANIAVDRRGKVANEFAIRTEIENRILAQLDLVRQAPRSRPGRGRLSKTLQKVVSDTQTRPLSAAAEKKKQSNILLLTSLSKLDRVNRLRTAKTKRIIIAEEHARIHQHLSESKFETYHLQTILLPETLLKQFSGADIARASQYFVIPQYEPKDEAIHAATLWFQKELLSNEPSNADGGPPTVDCTATTKKIFFRHQDRNGGNLRVELTSRLLPSTDRPVYCYVDVTDEVINNPHAADPETWAIEFPRNEDGTKQLDMSNAEHANQHGHLAPTFIVTTRLRTLRIRHQDSTPMCDRVTRKSGVCCRYKVDIDLRRLNPAIMDPHYVTIHRCAGTCTNPHEKRLRAAATAGASSASDAGRVHMTLMLNGSAPISVSEPCCVPYRYAHLPVVLERDSRVIEKFELYRLDVQKCKCDY